MNEFIVKYDLFGESYNISQVINADSIKQINENTILINESISIIFYDCEDELKIIKNKKFK